MISRIGCRRVGLAILIAGFVMGVGGCTRIQIDDLTFERLRVVNVTQDVDLPRSLVKFARIEGYPDDELIEVTLSTRRDLVEVMQRDDGWVLSARARKCAVDLPQGGVTNWSTVFSERKEVASLNGYFEDNPAQPESSKPENGRFFYEVFLRTRDVLRPNWDQDGYDLALAPFDVCVDVGASAFAGVIKFKSNVATIPASAFQAVFSGR